MSNVINFATAWRYPAVLPNEEGFAFDGLLLDGKTIMPGVVLRDPETGLHYSSIPLNQLLKWRRKGATK